MGEVSNNANESSKVAMRSMEIAKKGGDAVKRTMSGMDTIREHIQETSKRIKRLGESSQEIGDIVEIIKDIAEKSTSGVVTGAQLAEDAGGALEEIETVSDQLAELIKGMSGEALQQANVASELTETMNDIQELTTQATAGAEQTSRSIGNLSRMSQDLDTSVTGFKLPQ
jgi:twitching motility protein PilJ